MLTRARAHNSPTHRGEHPELRPSVGSTGCLAFSADVGGRPVPGPSDDALSATSLFAALDLASGPVIAQHYLRHRHQEFLRFLKLIDAAVPEDLDLHLVLDDYATRKTPEIHQWSGSTNGTGTRKRCLWPLSISKS
jgi:hypothetical protein